MREIQPERGSHFLEGLADVGIIPRGAGSDNIRNVTGSATAGIDPNELLDTRPHAKDWHHHILNTRVMYNLPRKFNVAFDGCGNIATLEDTNDIGFQAVAVMEGAPIPAGVYYRLAIGGISGHKDLARDTGVVLPPGDCIRIADAIIRVWSEHGDRTNRNHSRMKYVLDEWGFERFLTAVEEKLGEKLTRLDAVHVAPRPGYDRLGHIGVHPAAPGRPELRRRGAGGRTPLDGPDCARSPRSRAATATATSASPSGRTSSCPVCGMPTSRRSAPP